MRATIIPQCVDCSTLPERRAPMCFKMPARILSRFVSPVPDGLGRLQTVCTLLCVFVFVCIFGQLQTVCICICILGNCKLFVFYSQLDAVCSHVDQCLTCGRTSLKNKSKVAAAENWDFKTSSNFIFANAALSTNTNTRQPFNQFSGWVQTQTETEQCHCQWNVGCAIREGRGDSDGKLQCTWHNWHSWHNWHMAAILSNIEQMWTENAWYGWLHCASAPHALLCIARFSVSVTLCLTHCNFLQLLVHG